MLQNNTARARCRFGWTASDLFACDAERHCWRDVADRINASQRKLHRLRRYSAGTDEKEAA